MVGREENGQEAAVAATNEHDVSPKTILVVDDELFQLRRAHVHHVATSFYDTIADTTDPIFSNLWDVAKAIPGLGAGSWDEEQAAQYLSSDAAVSLVLLSVQFKQLAGAPLKQLLTPFTARAERVGRLKQLFQSAFPSPEFDLQFVSPPRPSLERITHCAAVFLDLFLEHGDGSPVEAVQTYLQQLSRDADRRLLPPLVLMSSHPELEQHKLRFSEKAGISAAGLMVLPKAMLMEPEFGATGLNLAFKQLDRQKSVAHAMRLFIGSWLTALNEAKEKTAQTLWNLDASAMQQIHLASVRDDDPYDEHLNELLSREHLFHVEAKPSVAESVSELDKCFRELLSPEGEGEIENRLLAPMTDIDTSRAFMSHFTWFGSPLPANFLSNEGDAASRISRSLPFGSVLCNGVLSHGGKCLVHITQQCDLNAISRSKKASRTVVFAAADIIELQASDNPVVKPSDLVARGLRIMQANQVREFDLRVNSGELIALPLSEFLDKTRSEGWSVVGRLRSDISNHIVAAITNQMSRPASQKMIRPALLRAKLFLQSASLEGGKEALLDKSSTATRKPAKIFSLSYDEGRYSFQDGACIEIALWLVHHSTTIGLQLDADALSTELSRGWRSQSDLPGRLRVKAKECTGLDKAFQVVLSGDINGNGAQLTVVYET
ncbi:hypothetical protein VI06_17650 [Aquitalea magnusonii]|nr:hypothetical protein VI06_17650 [Aquitalea magnusonii]QBJ80221.1 hypothetical protein DKK66_06945 [Aquitalea sp. USM4]